MKKQKIECTQIWESINALDMGVKYKIMAVRSSSVEMYNTANVWDCIEVNKKTFTEKYQLSRL